MPWRRNRQGILAPKKARCTPSDFPEWNSVGTIYDSVSSGNLIKLLTKEKYVSKIAERIFLQHNFIMSIS